MSLWHTTPSSPFHISLFYRYRIFLQSILYCNSNICTTFNKKIITILNCLSKALSIACTACFFGDRNFKYFFTVSKKLDKALHQSEHSINATYFFDTVYRYWKFRPRGCSKLFTILSMKSYQTMSKNLYYNYGEWCS